MGFLGSVLDKAIVELAPGWGSRRLAKRSMLAAARERVASLRAYEATDNDRTRGHDWLASKLSQNDELVQELDTLRERSNDVYRNEPFAASAVDGRVAYEIGGTGIRPNPQVREIDGFITEEEADKYNAELTSLYERWAPYASRCGCRSMVQIQQGSVKTWALDGDAILIASNVSRIDKPIPLSLELIETSRLQTPPELSGDPNTRLGITYDSKGTPQVYHIRTTHPGDSTSEFKFRHVSAFDRSGRRRVFHLYERKWPEQARGIPWLTPALARIKDIKDFTEAEIVAAQVAACFSVFIETPDPHGMAAGMSVGNASDTRSSRIEEVEPGRVFYTGPEEKVNFATPSRPGNTFGPWMEWQLRSIASAIGFPYEILVKDYSGTTYSSGRLSLIDGRVHFRIRQQVVIDSVLQPVWRQFVNQAVLTGELSCDLRKYNANPQAFERVNWSKPGWPWLDPAKEIEAAGKAMELNLTTLEEECSTLGRNYEQNLRQRSREVKMIKKLELPAVRVLPSGPPDPETAPVTPTKKVPEKVAVK